MPFRFGTQPRRFPVEGGDSSIELESGLSSSASCTGKETSPNRWTFCQLLAIISNSEDALEVTA
ncbi:protein FAM229B isoform 2 [Mus musculus]|uniref:Protein FAM229B n=1 Tax=Mus musculus TaxID=10090 RepID=D3Z2A8_MOUSE|nr:protein FAM229B isoform 2 [Mus musculus]